MSDLEILIKIAQLVDFEEYTGDNKDAQRLDAIITEIYTLLDDNSFMPPPKSWSAEE